MTIERRHDRPDNKRVHLTLVGYWWVIGGLADGGGLPKASQGNAPVVAPVWRSGSHGDTTPTQRFPK
ncbi:MAG: hypothetical protein ACO34J_15590 [Prochlorothrix sp.]